MFTQKTANMVTTIIKIALAVVLVMPMFIMQTMPVQAGTNVGGPIISDTTWTLANSPYIVTTSVDVQQNVTLTIEPGVTIRFNSGTKLQVNGELIARGIADNLIVFTSNQANPAPGDWYGIEFTSVAVPVVVDENENYVSGNVIQYCVVEYAGFEETCAVNASSLLIDNCTVQNNKGRGVEISGSDTLPGYVANSVIRNNQMGGIFSERAIVRGNTVADNWGTTYGGGIYAKNSELIENRVIGNMAEYSGGGIFAGKSIVLRNVVENNTSQKSYSDRGGGGIYATGSTVSQNIVIANNSMSYGGGILADGGLLTENIVRDNYVKSIYGGYGGGVYVKGSETFTNTITGNRVLGSLAGGSGIFVRYFIQGDVLYNTVVNNQGPQDSTSGGIQFWNTSGTGENLQVHYNTFYGNVPYDVSVQSGFDISGTHNYWGTVTNLDILAQIYDWYDDDSRGKFLYTPYLQEPSPDAPLPPPTGLSANFQNDSVTLTWDVLPSFITGWGYKVYYDTDNSLPPFVGIGLNEGDSPINVGDKTSYILTGLDSSSDYYFAVTAYDNLGNEGWYSNIIARKLGGYWVYLPLVIKK